MEVAGSPSSWVASVKLLGRRMPRVHVGKKNFGDPHARGSRSLWGCHAGASGSQPLPEGPLSPLLKSSGSHFSTRFLPPERPFPVSSNKSKTWVAPPPNHALLCPLSLSNRLFSTTVRPLIYFKLSIHSRRGRLFPLTSLS